MKTILLIFLLAITCLDVSGYEDSLARPTFIHTKHLLPAPWHNGEIIAEADYAGEMETARLRSLIIVIGKEIVKVPLPTLSLFQGARLGSLELYCGPEPNEYFSNRYFNVTFRFNSYSYEGIYSDPTPSHFKAWIIIENGKIKSLSKIKESYDLITSTDIDPVTLKEIRTSSSKITHGSSKAAEK